MTMLIFQYLAIHLVTRALNSRQESMLMLRLIITANRQCLWDHLRGATGADVRQESVVVVLAVGCAQTVAY